MLSLERIKDIFSFFLASAYHIYCILASAASRGHSSQMLAIIIVKALVQIATDWEHTHSRQGH